MKVQILHNPRCTKSRLTLALLEEKNLDIEIIEYLQTPPTFEELQSILKKLNKSAEEILRLKEAKEEQISNLKGDELIKAMIANPRTIERPIVITADKAAIGRPPENVFRIIDL